MKKISLYKKECRSIILIILLILFLIPFINANFICGKLKDSSNNVSSEWYNIRLSYPGLSSFSNCEVSPAENKYCCDVESIPGKSWKIGDIINAEVLDNETGYIAGPVSIRTTGEGYTIMPEMTLKKVITINNPIEKLFISNDTNVNLSLDLQNPYNYLELIKDSNKSLICTNCTSYNNLITSNFGMNKLSIIASNSKNSFSENIIFAILNYTNVNKNFSCIKCKKDNIPSKTNVSFIIQVNLSDSVTNFELKEYIPVGFEIYDLSGGVLRHYSDTHDIIIWNISGSSFKVNLILKSPNPNLFNTRYLFKTELENKIISEKLFTVYGYLPFFSLDNKILFNNIKNKKYSRLSPGRALVLKTYNSNAIKIGVFSNKKLRNVEFNLMNYKYNDELSDVINYYVFDTNIKTVDMEKLYIEFRVSKSLMKSKGYNNISLYILNNQEWEETSPEKQSEDKYSVYFRTYIPPSEGIAITGKK